jgi:hypothetical protein
MVELLKADMKILNILSLLYCSVLNWLIDDLFGFRPVENLSLILGRRRCRGEVANLDLCFVAVRVHLCTITCRDTGPVFNVISERIKCRPIEAIITYFNVFDLTQPCCEWGSNWRPPCHNTITLPLSHSNRCSVLSLRSYDCEYMYNNSTLNSKVQQWSNKLMVVKCIEIIKDPLLPVYI